MGYLKAPVENENELPSEGEHTATFKRFEDLGYIVTDYDKKQGSDKKRWTMNFFFDIEGIEQMYEVYPSLSQSSKFYEAIKALDEKDPPRDMWTEKYLPTLVGKKCLVIIKRYGNQLAVIKSDDVTVPAVRKVGATNIFKNAHGTMVDDSMVPF